MPSAKGCLGDKAFEAHGSPRHIARGLEGSSLDLWLSATDRAPQGGSLPLGALFVSHPSPPPHVPSRAQ